MKTAATSCALGAGVGFLVGEYSPGTFASGLDVVGAMMSVPFSPYRNDLAVKYALMMGAGGLVIGLLIHIASRSGVVAAKQ